MRLEVRNRVTMLGEDVVAEIAADAGLRRWLVLRPNPEGGVTLVEFEHDASLDTDSYFAPEDVQRRTTTDFDSLETALTFLEQRSIDTDSFDAPWKFDYPL